MYTRESEVTSSTQLPMASDHNAERTSGMAEPQHTTIRKTFKYRVSPKTKALRERLQHTLDLCRELYNCALEERKAAYRSYGRSLNYHDQRGQLPAIKRDRPELAFVHRQVLQDTLRRLDKAFQAFFRRVRNGEEPGYPRYNRFTYPQDSGWKLEGNKLRLRNIGVLNVILHRPVEGKIKTVTISRSASALTWVLQRDQGREPALVSSDGTQAHDRAACCLEA